MKYNDVIADKSRPSFSRSQGSCVHNAVLSLKLGHLSSTAVWSSHNSESPERTKHVSFRNTSIWIFSDKRCHRFILVPIYTTNNPVCFVCSRDVCPPCLTFASRILEKNFCGSRLLTVDFTTGHTVRLIGILVWTTSLVCNE